MTAERQELHELVDDLDESDVRAVLALVKARKDDPKTGPTSAGNAGVLLRRAMDPNRPRMKAEDLIESVEPIRDVRQLVHASSPLTPEERKALEEFLSA